MARDALVDLVLLHNTPRYVATGVDPNDLQRIVARLEHWDDWCRTWCDEAGRHEQQAEEALGRGRTVTATECLLRAAMYFHYAKHLFTHDQEQYLGAQTRMLRCYRAAAPNLDPMSERIEIPFERGMLPANLRRPRGGERAPVAILLPGLDACKEELHAWSDAFVRRGVATLALDGPGQGESALRLPVRSEWGPVIGAVIDALERRSDVDGGKVGIVGQSLGALYAPLATAFEPRIKACVSNCGPFDFGAILPSMPAASQETFRIRCHAETAAQARAIARRLTLEGIAHRIECPLLVVFGAGDRLIPAAEGERLARAVSGPVDFVVFEEGNHVCFNISYKFRPLTADWMAEQLSAGGSAQRQRTTAV
jgi:2,6-dihydroxypseudooxynicotine hydrolase